MTIKPGTVLAWSFMFALGLLGLAFVAIVYPRTTTTTIRGAETVSPYGTWKAFVEEYIDESGLGGAEIWETVYLGSLDRPGEVVQILAVETGGHHEAVPRLTWTAPGVLQITLANQFFATIERHAYQGLRIDLRFEPDDPRARETWMKAEGAPSQ